MRLKSYHADTVATAVRLAKVELGEEAVFLGSRENGGGPGRYEVTFAILDDDNRTQETKAAVRTGQSAPLHGGAGQPRRAHWRQYVPASSGEAAPGSDRTDESGGIVRPPRPPDPGPAAIRPAPEAPSRPPAAELELGEERPVDATDGRLEGATAAAGPAAAPAPVPALARRPPREPPPASLAAGPHRLLSSRTPLTDFLGKVSDEVRELRASLDHLRAELPLFVPSGEIAAHPPLAEIYAHLLGNDVEPGLALQITAGLRDALEQGVQREGLWRRLGERISSLCRVESTLGRSDTAWRAVALVGESGVGKTSTLAKLAIRYGLAAGRRAHLLGLSTLRVGATEQLQAYASLLEVPLTLVGDVASLPAVVQRLARDPEAPELLLIDTPGYSAAERPEARRLARSLAEVPHLDTHLVLPLTFRRNILQRSIKRFQVFQPRKLLFSKLDETPSFGDIVNEAVRTGLPLSFFSTGPRVPEDLAPVTEPSLLDLILKKELLK